MKPANRHGWVVVVLGAVVMLATLPGRTHGLGLVTEPLLADLKVDRVDFARINLWATLLGAAFCLPAGWAIDRLGLRLTTTLLLVATGASAWALSRQTGALGTLLVILTLTRGFGQSALSVSSISTVAKWFPRRSGPAMGVYAFLLGFLFAAAFGIVGWAVRTQGWRAAWAGVAAAVTLVIAPLILILLREPPGDQDSGEDAPSFGHSLGQALATPAFWVFAGAAAVFGLVSSGFGLFQQAVLEERGFDQQTYHAVLVGTTLVALVAQLVSGWLSLRCSSGALAAIAMTLYGAALAAFPWIASPVTLWAVAGLMGAAGGVITVVFFGVWGEAFGRAHLGRIQAAAQMLTVLASAVGPLLFAKVHEWAGSYSPALLTLAPVVLLIGLAAWRVRLPAREHAPLSVPQPSPTGVATP